MIRISILGMALIALTVLMGTVNATPFGVRAPNQRVFIRNPNSGANFLSAYPLTKTVVHAPCTGPIGPKHVPCR